MIDVDNGVLSKRYALAFFPGLQDNVHIYNSMSTTLYRELSEFVHGNAFTWELTKENLSFNNDLHTDWLSKFDTASTIISFALCLRFLKEVSKDALKKIERPVLDKIGHIEQIRDVFMELSK